MASRSIIGVTVSCSSSEGSAGIDTANNGTFSWFLWISFKFPGQDPVQFRVPVKGKGDDGELGDNNQDLAERIQVAAVGALGSLQVTDQQFFNDIHVESTERPDPAGGQGGQDYYMRVVFDGVESIDGGSDCPKIRMGGITGTWDRQPVGIGVGPPPPPQEAKAKRVPLPLPVNPGGLAPDNSGEPCKCPENPTGRQFPKPKKKVLPDIDSEAQEFEDVTREPTGGPGWRDHG